MNCLICYKPFVKEKEFENYNRNPELCTNTISKLFGISNDPDVQGVFEDLEVCRGCHQLLEKVWEMVTWFEELEGRVNQARILIKQMLDTSKDVSQPPNVNSRSFDMSKSNLDRLVLLKAIEARNPPPPSPSSAMDLQEEDDNAHSVYFEAIGENFQTQFLPNSKLTTVFQMREEIDTELFIDESYFSNNSTHSSVDSTMSIEAEKTLVISPDNSKSHKKATKKRKSFKSSSSEKSVTRSKPKMKQNKVRSEASTILLGGNGADENSKYTREFVNRQFINLKNGSFQCTQCFKILGKMSRRGHLLIHGPRKFKCSHCNKLFARKSRMISHVKGVHEKRKNFKCPIKECGKRLSRKDHLISHVRTVHEGKRDFKCQLESCDKAFTSKGHLNRHIDKVHKRSNKIQVLSISSPEDLEPISAQQMEVESIEDQMASNYDGMWHIDNAMEGQEEIQEDFDPYEYLYA